MKPKDVCIGLTCKQVKKVPGVLLCTGCTDYAAQKGWGPFNIVYCQKNEHKELRASTEDIKKAWEKYFGRFECKTAVQNIKVNVNFMFQVHNVSSRSRGTPAASAPTINSSSGAKVAPRMDKIIPEKNEDLFYMMQTLKIGSSTILAFLDSGSN